MHSKSLAARIVGFVSSLVLTLTAFLVFYRPDFFNLDTNSIVALLLTLAVLQGIVQSIFFLNILNEKGPRWNLIVFASTLSIVIIIIVFSIWIMHHLNCNMMCH
ncbi:MAG: cytochrome C oxidase subunit IV family protein [Verrucomicrobia bacterium]|nr:cytochrome C oxidase subunit IV family protein [Verrucomicrobiota bacterium]